MCFEYPKELCELHNDYLLASDKIEIKKGMLSNYQLKIANFFKIPIGDIKKLLRNLFDKENYVLQYEDNVIKMEKCCTN